MAILPLASFAADIADSWTVTAPSITYGKTAAQQGLTVVYNSDGTDVDPDLYDVTYYLADGTTPITGNLEKQSVGDYWVKVSASTTQTAWEGEIVKSFKINKASITVDVKDAAFFVKNYKAADPANGSIAYNTTDVVITFSAAPNGETKANSLTIADNVTYSYGTNQNANFQSNGTTPLTEGDNGYAITFAGISLKGNAVTNYNLVWTARYMKIKQIVFDVTNEWDGTDADTGFAVTETSGYDPLHPYAYSAENHTPTYQIVWKYGTGANDKMTLTSGQDFKFAYANTTLGGAPATTAINAGNYTASFASLTKKNFVANGTDDKNLLGEFAISKGSLTIMVMPRSKTYDGEAFTTAGATFYVTGWVTKDMAATIAADKLSVNGTDADALEKDAGAYPVHAVLNNTATYTRGGTTANVKVVDNYAVNVAVATNWTINKMAFTLKPKDQTKVWSAAMPDLTDASALVIPVLAAATETTPAVTAGAITDAEATVIKSAMKLVWGWEDYTAATPETQLNTNSPIDHYVDGILLTKLPDDGTNGDGTTKISDAQRAVLKNYTITLNNGVLDITGAGFKIIPVVAATEYGDEVTPAVVAFDATTNLPIEINENEVNYLYYKNNVLVKDENDNPIKPTEIGTYTVEIEDNPAIAKGNYVGGEIDYQTGTFNITKKALTLTVANLTLHKGDTRTILRKHAKLVNENGVKKGETIEYVFDFQAGTDDLAFNVANDYKITSNAGTYHSAIKATAAAASDDNDNAHYTFTFVPGDLTIAPGFVADLDAATAEGVIADAATNGAEYSEVYITDRKLKAGQWNVMVLPFNVSTFDFCKAIKGYAVFNTLKSASGSDVKFELQLAGLTANEPFLVKPQDNVDFDHLFDPNPAVDDDEYKDIYFQKVTFVNATPTKEAGDAKFIGTFKDITIPAAEAGYSNWAMQGGKFNDLGSDTPVLGFTRAYLYLHTSAGARITVVEADGSTTAIAGVTADGELIPAEGWYTLNGVKLQGIPTEKGVYINNGKKIVIK